MAAFNFEDARKIFQDAISTALALDGSSMVDSLKSVFQQMQFADLDKKLACDQAIRDKFLEESLGFSTGVFEKLLHLSVESAVAEVCSPQLPVLLLTDAFDILPLGKCEEIFYMVESKVSIWKQELFFNSSKNTLLRLCNDLLRRLSRSQNTVFCGRILLFLAKFFPFSERSGLNVVSEFNLDNVTTFGVKDDTFPEEVSKPDEDSVLEQKFDVDYNLYKKFWSLQDYFRNPNQCYNKIPWKTFCSHTNDVLSAFSTIKLDERRNVPKSCEEFMDTSMNSDAAGQGDVQQYFAKYLTSHNLLELQLGDSNFRRYVLLQFLIMFQYLDAPVKFKQDTQKLTEEQSTWLVEAIERVYRLLEDTPPQGAAFADAIRHIFKREELWGNWKNEGCPEFRPLATTDARPEDGSLANGDRKAAGVVVAKPRRLKRTLGDQIHDANKKTKCIIGNNELTRLWNLCPDNMAACRSKDRDFLPSMESYFEEAIDQLDPSVESQYKRINDANFGWRALRLLARRSLHFFTHGNLPITRLSDYLETHVRKLAKDLQQSSNAAVNAKVEPADEAEVEQMEPETDADAPVPPEMDADVAEPAKNAINSGDDSTGAGDSEAEPPQKPPVLCTMDQLAGLAKKLGAAWKSLAPKLGFQQDEVEYFESEHKQVEMQATTMLQIWLENETDATPDNLLYVLEGLGLEHAAIGILN